MKNLGLKTRLAVSGLQMLTQDTIKETLGFQVLKLYTDNAGTIINKSTIAANLQVKIPCFLFGEFDRQGGFLVAKQTTPPINWNYLYSYISGTEQPFLFATGANEIKDYIKNGDLVHIFTDNENAPSVYAYVIIHKTLGAYGSILSNPFDTHKMIFEGVNYVSNSDNQLQETFFTNKLDFLGYVKQNSVNPFAFKTPDYGLNNFVYIPLRVNLTHYLGFAFYILHSQDELGLEFKVKKLINN